MTRVRTTAVLAALVCLAGEARLTPRLTAQEAPRPMVAVLIVDGLRPDLITPETTPTLWRLQREGNVYLDSHSAFPSVTRVNGASLSTGAYPARHGLVGNTMYVPSVAAQPLSAGEWQNLARIGDASPDRRLLTVPTLAERVTAAGLTFVAVSSGTTGSGFVLNPEARNGVGTLIMPGLEPGVRVAFPDAANRDVHKKFDEPADNQPRTRLQWTERVVRDYVLPELRPDVLVDWLTEPDGAQHGEGAGSPAALAGLGRSDAEIARFLEAATRLGLDDRLHLIVTSDHGFARHSDAVSIIDVLVRDGAKASPSSDDVVVVGESQLASIHVKDRDRARIAQVARTLLTQPWVEAVFTAPASPAAARSRERTADPAMGFVPGTYSLDLIRQRHPVRGADLIVALRWSSEPNAYGVRGTQTVHSTTRSGPLTGEASGHGGIGPATMRNTLIVWGPRLRARQIVRLPAGIVDIAPTVLALLGLPATDGTMDGRVLTEVFATGPDAERIAQTRTIHRVATSTYEGLLQVSRIDGHWYVDKAWRVTPTPVPTP